MSPVKRTAGTGKVETCTGELRDQSFLRAQRADSGGFPATPPTNSPLPPEDKLPGLDGDNDRSEYKEVANTFVTN